MIWKVDFEKKNYNVSDFKIKIYNASDFDLKVLQRVRFWIEKKQCDRFWIKLFSTRQILKNCLRSEKSRFGWFYSVRTTNFAILCFLKSMNLY